MEEVKLISTMNWRARARHRSSNQRWEPSSSNVAPVSESLMQRLLRDTARFASKFSSRNVLPLTQLSSERPPIPMVKVLKKIIWEVSALIINQRCLVREAEALEELQLQPPLAHHNRSLKERFPSGNYKVCSSGRLSVSQNLPLTQV